MFVVPNGNVLSKFWIKDKGKSLGGYDNVLIMTFVTKMLGFFDIIDSQLRMFKTMTTDVQFTGACVLSREYLVFVTQEELIYYNKRRSYQENSLDILQDADAVPNKSEKTQDKRKKKYSHI